MVSSIPQYNHGPSTNTDIVVSGEGEVSVVGLVSKLQKLAIQYFLRDIESDGDYHYIKITDDDKYILVKRREMPHGSDIESDIKELNKSEIEIYNSISTVENFLIKLV
jgi:hypothetical protein